jgi:hypothetical protein
MFSFNEAGLSQEKNLNNERANIFFRSSSFSLFFLVFMRFLKLSEGCNQESNNSPWDEIAVDKADHVPSISVSQYQSKC